MSVNPGSTIANIDTVARVDRVMNLIDGTVTTVTGVDRVRNIIDGTVSTVGTVGTITRVDRVHNLIDGTISTVGTVTGITNSIAVHVLSTNGTIAVQNATLGTVAISAKDGSFAIYFSPSSPSIGTVNRVDRVHNVVDGTISSGTLDYVTRVRNLVDGTLTTVTGVDRIRNIVDGTISTLDTVNFVTRVRNVVDGTLTTVTGVDRVRNVVDGTITTVTGITNTVKISASDGTFAVYLSPSNQSVNTELPTAAALADSTSNPTVPAVGGFNMAWNGSTWDRAYAAKVHDLDTGGGTEYNIGVNLRTGGSGGSTEIGNSLSAPLFVEIKSPTAGRSTPTMTAADFSDLNRFYTAGFVWTGSGTTFAADLKAIDVTLLASGARSTTQTSADIVNYWGCSGLTVVLNMTDVSAGPSVTVSIDGKDVVSGAYYNLLTGSAITTVSTNPYYIGQGITVTANVSAAILLPKTFRIVVTANNANLGTYSVGYCLTQ